MTDDMLLFPISFYDKIVVLPNGCWQWTASFDDRGYGQYFLNGKLTKAHRAAWFFAFGSIGKGKFICHHCDNKWCVRPSHLFEGTQTDNIRDAVRKGRMYLQVHKPTHCKRGHELTLENSIWDNPHRTQRHCRTCSNQRRRLRRANERSRRITEHAG